MITRKTNLENENPAFSKGDVSGSLLLSAEKECNKRNEYLKEKCNADKYYCKAYEQGWIEAVNWVLQNYR